MRCPTLGALRHRGGGATLPRRRAERERSLALVCRKQSGAIGFEQLTELGFTEREVARLVAGAQRSPAATGASSSMHGRPSRPGAHLVRCPTGGRSDCLPQPPHRRRRPRSARDQREGDRAHGASPTERHSAADCASIAPPISIRMRCESSTGCGSAPCRAMLIDLASAGDEGRARPAHRGGRPPPRASTLERIAPGDRSSILADPGAARARLRLSPPTSPAQTDKSRLERAFSRLAGAPARRSRGARAQRQACRRRWEIDFLWRAQSLAVELRRPPVPPAAGRPGARPDQGRVAAGPCHRHRPRHRVSLRARRFAGIAGRPASLPRRRPSGVYRQYTQPDVRALNPATRFEPVRGRAADRGALAGHRACFTPSPRARRRRTSRSRSRRRTSPARCTWATRSTARSRTRWSAITACAGGGRSGSSAPTTPASPPRPRSRRRSPPRAPAAGDSAARRSWSACGSGASSTAGRSSSSSSAWAPPATTRTSASRSTRPTRRPCSRCSSRLYEKGYIYRDRYMVNWDPGLGSAISDLEVEERDETDTLYYDRATRSHGRRARHGRHRAPRDDARRHARSPCTPTTSATATWSGETAILPLVGRQLPIIADEYVKPDFGTGAAEDHPGARSQRLRDRPSATASRRCR